MTWLLAGLVGLAVGLLAGLVLFGRRGRAEAPPTPNAGGPPAELAASILAKTDRDAILISLDRDYPQYGFCRHKGYGTPEHLAALAAHGPCPAHRRSFSPVSQLRIDFA